MPKGAEVEPVAPRAGFGVGLGADSAIVLATFASAPDGIVALDAEGRILASNDALLALWNFPPEMLLRADSSEIRRHIATQLREPQRFLDSLPALRASRRTPVMEEVALLDGRVFERHIAPLDAPGVAGGVVVRWRDVTDRHRAQRALGESQARLEALFAHALNAILLADDQARYLDVNPAACALLGYSREELLALAVTDVLVPDTIDVDHQWAGFLNERQSRGRVQLRRKDGSVLVAQFAAVAHMLPGVHLSVMSDITEEVRAQQRQQELGTLLELAMMGADLAYWDVDLQRGTLSSVNGHWHTMLGYEAGEIGSSLQAWEALVHPEDLPQRDALWQAHLRGETARYEVEFRLRHKAGHWVWVLSRGRVVARDAQGTPTRMVGTRMDISGRKQAELHLRAQAHTDGLTGLFNRRRFVEMASAELAQAQREGHPTALLMVDLDHFKQINDRLGHAAGDAVLRAFAQASREVMRERDVFGRVGGEEFAALLPHTGPEGAVAVAARLQQQVGAQPAQVGGQRVGCTLSVGVACVPGEGGEHRSIDALMQAADRALYIAKTKGRNRVVVDGGV